MTETHDHADEVPEDATADDRQAADALEETTSDDEVLLAMDGADTVVDQAPTWIDRNGPKVAISVIITLLLALLALFIFTPTTTPGAFAEGVDGLLPTEGSTVLRQSTIGIDVKPDHDALLVINGKVIDGLMELDSAGALIRDGLNKNLESGLITYTPKAGGRVESLKKGKNCVQARVWATADRPEAGQTVSWCFNAS